MKIYWFVNEGDVDGSLSFETAGELPTVGSTVYIRDIRTGKGTGTRIQCKVERVDTCLRLATTPLSLIRDKIVGETAEERCDSMAEIVAKDFDGCIMSLPTHRDGDLTWASQYAEVSLLRVG